MDPAGEGPLDLHRAGALMDLYGLVAYTVGQREREIGIRVDPKDPWVLVAVFDFLGGATLAAAAVPALRAGRVDPVEAIRR